MPEILIVSVSLAYLVASCIVLQSINHFSKDTNSIKTGKSFPLVDLESDKDMGYQCAVSTS
jgi:hypothetical protein